MAQVDNVQRDGLKRYYFLRAGVSVAWIVAAVAVGNAQPAGGRRAAGGLSGLGRPGQCAGRARQWRPAANAPQALQPGGQPPVALAVLFALQADPRRVLTVFGIWAGFAGLLQLAAGVRRWRSVGGQWPMVLSGAQSVLAGIFMITQSLAAGVHPLSAAAVAPYAGFGAFYFLVAAVALTLKRAEAGLELSSPLAGEGKPIARPLPPGTPSAPRGRRPWPRTRPRSRAPGQRSACRLRPSCPGRSGRPGRRR
jgi:hypothetical protein